MQGGQSAPTHPWGPRKVARESLNTVVALLYLKPAPVPTAPEPHSCPDRSDQSAHAVGLAAARRDPRRSGNLYPASSSKQAPTEGTVKTLSVLPSHRIDHLRRGAVLVVEALPGSRLQM